jgi:uncharacterized protein YkwD
MRIATRVASLGLFSLLSLVIAQAQTAPTRTAAASEQELFLSVNRARAAQNAPLLQWNDGLAQAARKHASIMAQHGAAQHGFPGEPALAARVTQAGVRFSWLSENVCQGNSYVAIEMQFMKSPNHRANILDPDMNAVGIGVIERNGQLYAVEDFSKVK